MKNVWFAALLVALSGNALAHGEDPRAGKGVDYSKAEETPFGRAADPKKAKRTIRVEMTDQMRFHPAEIAVKRGEVIRFVPVNKGQVMHEMVIGTLDELKKHAELMKKHPGMEHDEPHMAHVAPGKEGVIGWQFTKAGEFFYGCLIAGHFDAGMIGKVTVADSSAGMASGEVRKVDKDAKKITLRHGPIPNLDMPAHTMVFQVRDPAMLDQVKVGDKVRFEAEKLGGAFMLTRIEVAR